jgi:hypothetical protein
MKSHQEGGLTASPMNAPNQAMTPVSNTENQTPSLPPLPPMPGGVEGLPPLPPMPGGAIDPTAGFQPQINPGFMESVNQSQNHLTEAGQQLTDKYSEREATRQQKIDELGASYDSAVEKNREIQGLPPTNDHTTFPLPPPPQR